MANTFNVVEEVPEYLKHQYQEGTAIGLKIECGNGHMESETTVPMFKSRFLRMAIKKKRRAEGLHEDDEVVLKFPRFETNTMKYFFDGLYMCNVEPVPLPELLKMLQLTSKMGFTEEVEGKQDFKCTAKMVENLLSCIEKHMETLSTEERIDIAFTISHFPDEGIQGVFNKCVENVTADGVLARAFKLQYCRCDLSETNFVHDVIRLCLEDDRGEDASDDQVTKEIVGRAINIAKQLSPVPVVLTKQQFLDSPDILRDVSLEYLTNEMGGTIYVNVGGEIGNIKSMITPPSSATHVLFGVGLKDKPTLEMAVVAKKEDIFEQQDYLGFGDFRAKKVRNFYVYYRRQGSQQIGFSGEEYIRFDGCVYDTYDIHKMGASSIAGLDSLDDHRLCIMTTSGTYDHKNVVRCGKITSANSRVTPHHLPSEFRTVFVHF